MKHFSEEDCADFANRTATPERLSEMEAHLNGGCAKCKESLHFWQLIKELASEESAFEPGEDTVRLAIGTYAVRGPRPHRGVFREIAQLVFDSLREPILAGVRGGHTPCRRLMFRAGEVMIDLSMEAASRRSHVMLVGQVLDTSTSGIGIGEVPIHLLNGRDTLAETHTNLYGEFQLECSENKNLQISIGVTQDKDVFIPLDESIWKTPSEYGVH
jgi:hypothetical protein